MTPKQSELALKKATERCSDLQERVAKSAQRHAALVDELRAAQDEMSEANKAFVAAHRVPE